MPKTCVVSYNIQKKYNEQSLNNSFYWILLI